MGAWIFAETPSSFTLKASSEKTTVTVRDTYTVAFNFVSGSVTIGFEAQNASGNWLAVDNFRLTLVGNDLSAELAAAIQNAETSYATATGKESQQLTDAIAHAKVVATKADAVAEEQAAAIVGMDKAIDIYLRANSSEDSPLDMTGRITNPSFETGDFTGWSVTNMGTQNNDIFTLKKGSWYVESWTWRGNTIGDARLSQTLTELPAGRYRLKFAAQNIQEDTPNVEQTGAWLFAGGHTVPVTVRANYTLEFVQVADVMEIGFEAKGATGNWLSLDNFQLEYISDNYDDVKTEFALWIAKAEALVNQRMNSTVQQALADAIAAARTALDTESNIPASASTLEATVAVATTSQEVFGRLANAIAAAQDEIDASAAIQKDDYQAAINAARAVYEATSTTNAQAEAAIAALAEASFAFKILNGMGSGTPPTVVTDTRYIRGCTWAFGRSTVSGSDIIEEGFCWSEQPDPKVTDNRTTEYLNQAGRIYWLRELKPATVYYMRAYAINKDYAVGYGEVIKFITVPKGKIGWWYNNGGDEDTNARLNYAIGTAVDYYWNNCPVFTAWD